MMGNYVGLKNRVLEKHLIRDLGNSFIFLKTTFMTLTRGWEMCLRFYVNVEKTRWIYICC